MDTNQAPVCPLIPHDIHLMTCGRVQRGFSDIQDERRGPSEEQSSTMGEEGTNYQRHRPGKSFQYILDL